MVKSAKIVKTKWCYALAFLLPWMIAVVHGLIFDVWPMGEDTLLTGDLKAQYIQLYDELWNKVHNGDSLFYSWNAMGGYDFYVNFTYYLMSPFSFIVLLVPQTYIMDALQAVIVLKWSCVAVSSVYFFNHTRFNRLTVHKEIVSLFLGLAFSLGNGMVMFLKYPNWLDAMILFPILLLCLERLVEKKRWKTYCVLLSLVMICNYYIAFQICIFLVIWFLILLDSKTSEKLKKFFIFATSSVLSALVSAIVLIPSVYAGISRFSDNKDIGRTEFLEEGHNTLVSFAKSMFSLNDIVGIADTTPNMYFTVLGAVLAFCYILNDVIRKRQWKLFAIWLFMTASFFVAELNLLWHGFQVPNGIYNRFVNMYVFLMLFFVLQMLQKLEHLKLSSFSAVSIASILLVILAYIEYGEKLPLYAYIVTTVMVLVYFAFFIELKKDSVTYNKILIVLVCFGICEAIINSLNAFDDLTGTDLTKERNFAELSQLVEETDLEEGERISIDLGFDNAGLLLDKPIASGFLSCGSGGLITMYKKLGLSYENNVKTMNTGGTPLLNLMFNIRYGINEKSACYSDVKQISKINDISLYEMQHLAGLGYMVDESIEQWDINSGLTFALQNDFIKKSTKGDSFFTTQEVGLEGAIMVSEEVLEPIEYTKKDDVYIYTYSYSKDRGNSLRVEFEVEKDMELYTYVRKKHHTTVQAFIDDVKVMEDTQNKYQNIIYFGHVKKGQNISIILDLAKHKEYLSDYLFEFQFAEFDADKYLDAYEKLSQNTFQIEEMESDYIRGTINADKDGVMYTSITAHEGFTIFVDGKRTEPLILGEALLGVPLEKGQHTVEFRYITPYFLIGAVVSCVGVFLFAVFWMLEKIYANKYLCVKG